MRHFNRQAVALPLKGNEFQANHNKLMLAKMRLHAVALPLKGNEFQANHNFSGGKDSGALLLLYLSKVTNFKQITTDGTKAVSYSGCCFTSQR